MAICFHKKWMVCIPKKKRERMVYMAVTVLILNLKIIKSEQLK